MPEAQAEAGERAADIQQAQARFARLAALRVTASRPGILSLINDLIRRGPIKRCLTFKPENRPAARFRCGAHLLKRMAAPQTKVIDGWIAVHAAVGAVLWHRLLWRMETRPRLVRGKCRAQTGLRAFFMDEIALLMAPEILEAIVRLEPKCPANQASIHKWDNI